MILISCFLAIALQGPLVSTVIPSGAMKPTPPASSVVATVNGAEIRAGDIEPLLWQIYHEGIENDFIDYLTVLDAAKPLHLTVTDQEVQTSVDQFLAAFKAGLPPGTSTEEGLRQKGFSDARLYLRARTEVLLHKIQLHDFHQADWVKVSTLVFATPGSSPATVQSAVKKAQSAYSQLEKGAPWTKLLRELVSDQRVINNDGSIGWHPLSAFPAEVKEAFLKMKPGGYTAPAQTSNGVQVFRLDKLGATAVGPDLTELQNDYLANTRGDTIREIKARAKVVKY